MGEASAGVDEGDWLREGSEVPIGGALRAILQAAAVERIAGPLPYQWVHSVLHLEHVELALEQRRLQQSIEQGVSQALGLGLLAHHDGRQLLLVTNHDDLCLCLLDGNQASRLRCLRGFIYDDNRECFLQQHIATASNECAADHICAFDELVSHLPLQPDQFFHIPLDVAMCETLALAFEVPSVQVVLDLLQSLPCLFNLGRQLVRLELCEQGVISQLLRHFRWKADAQRIDAQVQQTLQ
mmetsp:Transcript_84012/g.271557  ORF Transcript_84012/g.271557 Transcript_84012/m.271557 type:complete len:240 (+) Transcript_84012:668-1387(+)